MDRVTAFAARVTNPRALHQRSASPGPRRTEPHGGEQDERGQQPKLVVMDRTNGRLNMAYQNIAIMPKKYVEKFGPEIRELELTGNRIRDYYFLMEVPHLTTLILDRNNLNAHVTFPKLTELTTLSLNHNAIDNLTVFITTISSSFPNLKFLSMMNNEAAPSYFNGGSYMQYQDYRHYVISQLYELRVLDDTSVKTEEREEAGRVYGYRVDTKKKRKKIKSKSFDFPDIFAPNEAEGKGSH